MIKAECDRCGKQQETDGRSIRLNVGIMSRTEVRLPPLWHYVAEPVDDEAVEWPRRALCPECVNALRKFFQGDGAVPGLLEPVSLEEAAAVLGCTCPQPEPVRPPCPVHTGPDSDEVFRDAIRAERRGCIAHGGPDCICEPEDPRPNLTARAELIAGGLLPVGAKTAPCPNAGDGVCSGVYRRGEFHEHMKQAHGIPVARGSEPCPFCPVIEPGSKIGAHIAKDHPGEWQAWVDQRNRGGGETA